LCTSEIIDEKSFYDPDYTISQYSKGRTGKLIIFIDAFYMDTHYNGINIFQYKNINYFELKKDISKRALSIIDYRILISRHYDERLNQESAVSYWANKKARKLRNSPEKIFHKDLYSYLQEYVVDASVNAELSNNGNSDRLDIYMEEFNTSRGYIIEIKWIGMSQSNTSYSHQDMCNAFTQLNIYIKNNPKSQKGILVVYDGTDAPIEISCNTESLCYKIDKNPIQIYLESKSASVKAKKKYTR
jgi:hypothetical protein